MLISPTKLANNSNVAVVGAGVAGLSFSYFLAKFRPDVNITIIDAANGTGGWINSAKVQVGGRNSILVEKGPRTLRGKSEGTTLMIDTLDSLKQKEIVNYIEGNSVANRKFLLGKDDSLVQVPTSFKSFVKFLRNSLSEGLITGFLAEPFRKPRLYPCEDESAHSFVERRFGSASVSNNIFSAIFHGIYAGDIKQLSAQRTLAPLLALEAKHGSLIKGMMSSSTGEQSSSLPPALLQYQKRTGRDFKQLSELYGQLRKLPMLGLRNGLESFPRALFTALQQNSKVKFLLGSPVSQIEAGVNNTGCRVSLADGRQLTGLQHVRLTNTPAVIATMTQDKQLAQLLRQVKANTVVLVNFYLADADLLEQYHSFGYLVPQSNSNREQLLGVIFDSVIEQNFKPLVPQQSFDEQRKPQKYTKFTAMMGGHYLSDHSQQKDAQYVDRVKSALVRHLKIPQNQLDSGHWEVTMAKECLPHFFVNYNRWMSQTKTKIGQTFGSHLSLGGMAFSTGPGVPDVVMDGFQDADALS
ncbi:LAFA_0D07778g1_1 [Lachancea sp. 'fantastica']|nr:LAFA_0D07778g1_1 [Lachancea sp. 'fantastica']